MVMAYGPLFGISRTIYYRGIVTGRLVQFMAKPRSLRGSHYGEPYGCGACVCYDGIAERLMVHKVHARLGDTGIRESRP